MSNVEDRYDLAVIGAGINGAGIARDAALRGLKVVLVEQSDMCSSTSAISSRLIHGGLRYLEYAEFGLVFESLRERIILRRIAGHLVEPIRIAIPIYQGAKRGPLLIRIGMLLYDLLSFGKKVPGHDMLSRDEVVALAPGLRQSGLRGAARYYDAQVTFSERLVLENLLAAKAAGASIRTYTRVDKILRTDRAIEGIETCDQLNGKRRTLLADVVVNAAGPWVDSVLESLDVEQGRMIGGTKGSHIVVGQFDGGPEDAFYVEAESDGRPFFIIPWNGQYLIGTTDIRYDGDLDSVRPDPSEIDYLLTETNRVFPAAGLSKDDIHYSYAGVRPLPYRDQGPESAITRRHLIKTSDQAAGLINIIGGKLTTYRNLGRQTVDKVGALLRRKLPDSRTDEVPLPGAIRLDEAATSVGLLNGVTAAGRERLLSIYGGRAVDIVSLVRQDSRTERWIDAAKTILAAEVTFAIREEMARTLTDIVFRRMMVGLMPDQGRSLYADLASVAAAEFGWSDEQKRNELQALLAYSDSWGA